MFSKRFNFLTVAGIHIGIDLSWFFIAILLSWTLAAGYFPFTYPGQALSTYWIMGVIGMLGLFICILLHELGHAFVAKYFKLPISQITLFLFGGVAEIKKEATSPKVEFLVAIGGPVVTLLLIILLSLFTHFGVIFHVGIPVLAITSYLAAINTFILLFNLIPAFPLDGGRIFRAILWAWKKDLAWATTLSTRVGMGFGFFMIFFGIFSFITGNLVMGLWMAILGLFLQRAASSSQTQFYVGKELQNEKVAKFMKKNLDTVPPDITIQTFIQEHVYKSHHHLYPVIEEEKLLGFVSLNEVKSIPQEYWNTQQISSALHPLSKCQVVSPKTNALEALNIMQETGSQTLLVAEGTLLVGLLTAQDLFKVISLKLEIEESLKK